MSFLFHRYIKVPNLRSMIKNTILIPVFILLAVSGCSSQLNLTKREQNTAQAPERWQQAVADKVRSVEGSWLQQLQQPQIFELVDKALANNQSLLQLAYDVDIKQQQLEAEGASLWPSLDLSANSGRNRNNRPVGYSNASSVNLEAAYEIDLWGKLSASKREARLNFLVQEAQYEQARQQLVADVVNAWFNVITQKKLLALYEQRKELAKSNLEIIESGYRQGLNEALDVYLTRNELNNERSRIASQKAEYLQSIRTLERLLGDYPSAELMVTADLPVIEHTLPLGIPSELITRKPSLMASWYQLLGSDAALAYAHKQRFPSLRLTASLGDSTSDFDDLFSPSGLAWSLFGGLTMPLFQGGRLKANETAAEYAVKREEQRYLQQLYDAFTDVENAITQEQSLISRYETTVEAEKNARAAEQLSFEQYQKGLVSYATVLEAQNRSFEAQSSVIEIKNQMIGNRIALHIALGGDFAAPKNDNETSL